MSAPATKAFSPAPVKTTTATESSLRNAVERGADVQLHLPVHRVADVRPVDGDQRDAVGDVGQQRFVGDGGGFDWLSWRRPLPEGGQAGDGLSHDQGVDLVGALIGADTFQVVRVPQR